MLFLVIKIVYKDFKLILLHKLVSFTFSGKYLQFQNFLIARIMPKLQGGLVFVFRGFLLQVITERKRRHGEKPEQAALT